MKNKTLIDYLKKWALETPYKIAYTFFYYNNGKRKEEHITCGQLYEQSVNYAKYFKKIGVNKGDRIIIFAEQRAETLYAIYGVMMARGILILVPTPSDKSKERRFSTTLESSGAKYILHHGEKVDIVKNTIKSFISIYDIEEVNEEISLDAPELEDTVCLQYTSGSVNVPKGIMITHKNIMASVDNMKIQLKQNEEDVSVSWLPFFHTMGLIMEIFYNTYINRRDIIMSLEVFQEKPLRWLKAISKYEATNIVAPNSAYMTCSRMIKEQNDHFDFSNLRVILNCSEIIQKNNWDVLNETFKPYGLGDEIFYPAYGLSETTGLATIGNGKVRYIHADWEALKENKLIVTNKNNKLSRVMASVGTCVKGIKIVIVDIDKNIECQQNEIGEIWIQGDIVAKGYWNNEEATREIFNATLPNYEGKFLRTGDLGVFLDDELYITGRIKEMMVVNGKNIYAKDIELYIKQEIPQIQSAVIYAFTVPVKKRESVVIGVEYVADEEELIKLSHDINKVMYQYFNFEAYNIFFTQRNGLPRTDNGKLALMKIYNAYVGKNIEYIFNLRDYKRELKHSNFTKVQLEIKMIFEKILGIECKSTEDSFLELGGTSLEIFNLIMELRKKFNLSIGIKELIENSSIKGIEERIENNQVVK